MAAPRPGNPDRGWNDPPVFDYQSSNNSSTTLSESPRRTVLNKRVAYPLSSDQSSPTVLLYGSESWHVTNTITNKIQTFVNRCLHHIPIIRWLKKISSADLWERTNQNPASQDIKKLKWGLIDHTLRKKANNLTRQTLGWNPQGSAGLGDPDRHGDRSTARRRQLA
ncbi:hypothetical protein C0Q70_06307 [Pomacea canaliculata]|uniref:Uncharacterized protein n=1 Tax=Pomacea canaliculata TaxID=400727 RepID=A0A2T7PNM6_POMCA|nr:hypothetical protein C0Q70_06307 [Pomacea canaliculata]